MNGSSRERLYPAANRSAAGAGAGAGAADRPREKGQDPGRNVEYLQDPAANRTRRCNVQQVLKCNSALAGALQMRRCCITSSVASMQIAVIFQMYTSKNNIPGFKCN